MTGGRVKRIEKYVKGDTFLLTYGDGVGNVDLKALVDFHHQRWPDWPLSHWRAATGTFWRIGDARRCKSSEIQRKTSNFRRAD